MIVVFGFIIFLLSLYLLSREDFVFLRRNVSTEQIFDIAFLDGLVSLFLARIIYVAFHFTFAYFNPLVFFLVPYFPGLGISGAIMGSFFFLLLISRNKKIPTGHLLDVFSVSFFYAFSATLFGYGLLALLNRQFFFSVIDGVWGIISLSLSILFGSILMKSIWKDGNMSTVIVVCISIVLLITRGLMMFIQKPFVFDKELILFFFILIGASVMGLAKKFMQRSNF